MIVDEATIEWRFDDELTDLMISTVIMADASRVLLYPRIKLSLEEYNATIQRRLKEARLLPPALLLQLLNYYEMKMTHGSLEWWWDS